MFLRCVVLSPRSTADEGDERLAVVTTPARTELPPWRVLIVDDEPDVHAITRLVLRDTAFEGRKVEFLNAYSAEEARSILAAERSIAAAIVDVVMETDDAGLRLAKWIREELGNRLVRIILRTGRPGEAPERSVIVDYDINDYREKSELTDVRLLTMLVSALRSYRDLHMLEVSRKGFERIAEASGGLFRNRTVPDFVADVLVRLASFLVDEEDAMVIDASGVGVVVGTDDRVIAGTGRFEPLVGRSIAGSPVDPRIAAAIARAGEERRSIIDERCFAGYYRSADGRDVVLVLSSGADIGDAERAVLEAFHSNVALAFQNLTLNQHVEQAQREMIYMLGEAVEKRSEETGYHVRRVARLTALIARTVGISASEARSLELAAPLHDIGKIAIPDDILKKRGALTPDEMQLMMSHTVIGHQILQPHQQGVLRDAAEIALSHHERWQGQGYPNGLTGEAIPLSGRIVAVADVADALSHDRVYKPAWPAEDVFAYLEREAGVLFDPGIVRAVLSEREMALAVLLDVSKVAS